ncbi:MAG: CDP-alcohol phosphatidyltransferase family protein [archaeon]
MVESIRELKKKCMGTRPETKVKWQNHIAIYLTKLFLYTPLTANQICILWIAIEIAAIILLIKGTYFYYVLSMLLVQISAIIDTSDGQVARYKNNKTVLGYYTDLLAHSFFVPLTFICLGIGISRISQDYLYLFLGIGTSILFLIRDSINNPVVNNAKKPDKKLVAGKKVQSKGSIIAKIRRLSGEWLELSLMLSVMFFGLIFNLPKQTLWVYFIVILLNLIYEISSTIHYLLKNHPKLII